MSQKSISQLDTISQAHDTDLFEVAAVDGQSASGYKSGKMSAEVLAEGLLSTYTYPTAMPNMQNKTITGALNQLLANFAPVYDDTETYSVGDVCTYNGQLYKCTTAVSTAETFDPTKWAAIVVTELSGGHNYSTSEQIVGTWVDGSPIYEITLNRNVSSISDEVDLTSLSIDKLIRSEGYDKQSGSANTVPLPYYVNSSDYGNFYYNHNSKKLMLRAGSNYGQGDWWITLQYTKLSS